jgi:hypothetical protein
VREIPSTIKRFGFPGIFTAVYVYEHARMRYLKSSVIEEIMLQLTTAVDMTIDFYGNPKM